MTDCPGYKRAWDHPKAWEHQEARETYEQRRARLSEKLRQDKTRDEIADYRRMVFKEADPRPPQATLEEQAAIAAEWGVDDPPPGFLEKLERKQE